MRLPIFNIVAFFNYLLMLKLWDILLAIVYIILGLLSLITAFLNPSFMERLRKRKTQSGKNFSRAFFILLAVVLIYLGTKFLYEIMV
jgi:hypothetical protein